MQRARLIWLLVLLCVCERAVAIYAVSNRPQASIKYENETSRSPLTVVCPDGSSCSDSNTCCPSGGKNPYMCCPYPNAACCADLVNCCPNGYACDLIHGECVRSLHFDESDDSESKQMMPLTIPFLHKSEADQLSDEDDDEQALARDATFANTTCPAGECPDTQTCCQAVSGWGCCPYEDATCCSDLQHCCPSGYQCDVTKQQCVLGQHKHHQLPALWPWAPLHVKQAETDDDDDDEEDVGSVTCPDGSSCSNNNTCCANTSGGYGCCPLPSATCCSDKLHCCPSGYTCDLTKGECVSAHHAHTEHHHSLRRMHWKSQVPSKPAPPSFP